MILRLEMGKGVAVFLPKELILFHTGAIAGWFMLIISVHMLVHFEKHSAMVHFDWYAY